MSSGRAAPDSTIPYRAEQVGHQEGVDHEAGAVGRLDGLFPQLLGQAAGAPHGFRAGGESGNELDEPLYGHGVEEVHPDDLRGSLGDDGEIDDGDRGGVGGQDRRGVLDRLVQGAQDVGLDVAVLGDGLDDELTVGHVAEVMREGEPGEGLLPLLLAELAAPYASVQGRGEPAAACRERVRRGLGHTDVDAAEGGDFGDAGAHEAAAHDAEPGDGIHPRSSLTSRYTVHGRDHTLRRYWPPTSKNASVICWSEQTLAASMRTAKTLRPSMAASLRAVRAVWASSRWRD